jgi:hypothetical protein
MGVHIKTRTSYGGYIRNVVYDSNHFETAGVPGGAIHLESGYQSGGAGAPSPRPLIHCRSTLSLTVIGCHCIGISH